MFKQYIISYRSNIFFFFLSLPLIILIILISPIIKIKIGELKSRIIGEFTLPPEIFLCELKDQKIKKNFNELHLWFFNHIISNQYLANHWRKKFIIIPRIILEPIYYFFISINLTKDFLCPWRFDHELDFKEVLVRQNKDIYNLLPKYPVSLKFNNEEILRGEQSLIELGYRKNQKIVCFANRDQSFKNEKITSLRNANIFNYKKGINYLAEKNIFNLRMGRKHLNKIDYEKDNVVDYSFSQQSNDFQDLYIFSRCEFLVSTDHGINDLATLFRKNRFIVNFQAFHKLQFLDENFTPLIIPKKFLDLKNKNFIPYKTVYEKKLMEIAPLEKLNELGYDLVENTEEEIYKGIEEMYELMYNQKVINSNNQNIFWEIHEKYFNWRPKRIRISSSFFNENKDLFN